MKREALDDESDNITKASYGAKIKEENSSNGAQEGKEV